MLTLALPLMSKTRLASLPLMDSSFAPGPSIVTIVADVQVAAGQRDVVELVRELDGRAARCGADNGPERAGPLSGMLVTMRWTGQPAVLQ